MAHTDRASQRQATISVLGVLAIPLLSVSSAALVAGPVSSADPVGVAQAAMATIAGSLVGLVILRLVRAAAWFIETAAATTTGWIAAESSAVIAPLGSRVAIPMAAIPATYRQFGAVSRRGPPLDL